jgi:hypothetical protein
MRWAADEAHLELLQYLVERYGADPRVNRDATIVSAGEGGRLEIVDYLAGRIFHPERWRKSGKAGIERLAHRLASRIERGAPIFIDPKPAIECIARHALAAIHNLRAERARAKPPLKLGRAKLTPL